MTEKEEEYFRKLCERATQEEDLGKLLKLVAEIDSLLEARQRQRMAIRAKSG